MDYVEKLYYRLNTPLASGVTIEVELESSTFIILFPRVVGIRVVGICRIL